MNENPYIFLKNNFFLQFLIADRFRIYRHIVACSSLLAFLVLTKQWGDYEGMIDHWDWIERWLGLTATFYLNMYVLTPRFFLQREARYLYHPPYTMGLLSLRRYLLSQFCTMERVYDRKRNHSINKNSCFYNNFFLLYFM